MKGAGKGPSCASSALRMILHCGAFGLAAALLGVPALSKAATPPAPTIDAPTIDHVGINVPDADAAARFFHDLIGTKVVLDLHPSDPDAGWKAHFRWHPSARIVRLLMIQTTGGSRLELFQYDAPDADRELPYQDDPGATHIALKANDIDRSLAVIKQRGLRILNEPVTLPDGSRWFYFLTPWNAQIELVFPPASPR